MVERVQKDSKDIEIKTVNLSFKVRTSSSRKSLLARFFSAYRISPVQGEPFTWGVEVNNISDAPSPEIEITNAHIVSLDKSYWETADKTVVVRPLNPNETIFVEIDRCTVFLEGVMWAKFLVRSRTDEYDVVAYQVDENHNKLMKCDFSSSDAVNWLKDIYIHKKSEVLQGRTNNLIISLTIITVVEAVFTIKGCLRFLFWCGAEFFGLFVSVFSFLKGLL